MFFLFFVFFQEDAPTPKKHPTAPIMQVIISNTHYVKCLFLYNPKMIVSIRVLTAVKYFARFFHFACKAREENMNLLTR